MTLNQIKNIIFIIPFVFFFSFLNAATTVENSKNIEEIVKGIISSQLQAFKEENVEEAYSFAAPSIKKQFSNPGNFGLMVRKGYPVIWKPKSYQFVKFSTNGKRSIQRVLFKSDTDALLTYDYLLENFNGDQCQKRIFGSKKSRAIPHPLPEVVRDHSHKLMQDQSIHQPDESRGHHHWRH